MEIFTLLETIEDILENSKKIPFSNKHIVDKDELLDVVKEIRLKLPDELKQAKWVKEERTRIIQEAKKEGEDIVKEAENRIIAMIDEHEITRKAYEEKNVKSYSDYSDVSDDACRMWFKIFRREKWRIKYFYLDRICAGFCNRKV